MSAIESCSPPVSTHPDPAMLRAEANYAANLHTIAITQPKLSHQPLPLPHPFTWLFARDGSLTAMLENDRWWANCSVPRRAADFMFRNMDIGGTVACFLSPGYSAQLRVALDKLEPQQAIVAIVPLEQTLAMILHCDDFSADIAARRLWFAAGEKWATQLETLFSENPGLPTATQFIRPIVSNQELADRLIAPAQTVFAEVTSRRTQFILKISAGWKPKPTAIRQLCLVAPSRMRLWDDAGAALNGLSLEKRGFNVERLDSDRPDCASPVALVNAAAECDALIAPNLARSTLPGIVPVDLPWITWVTTPRIPSAEGAGPRDKLLLADPAWDPLARHAGWSASHITTARWPMIAATSQAKLGAAGYLSVIADTHPLKIPARVAEYSSQGLLWDWIQGELTCDPFQLGENIEEYLDARRARFQIGQSGFDAAIFIERLIIPACQQGLASLLIRESLPLRLFGSGWDSIDEFLPAQPRPVRSRAQLAQIVSDSTALIHAWPWRHAHPIDGAGRPVIRAFGMRRDTFLKEARASLRGSHSTRMSTAGRVLSPELISEVLAAL